MLYFVSVNYYSTALLRQLLSSVSGLLFRAPYQFIVVNNSPDDRSVEALEAEFEQVIVLPAVGNLGFGGGCNLGFDYAYQQDPQALVWLINPDALLVPQAVTYIQDCFERQPTLSILGTRIRASEEDVWFAKGHFNPWTGSLKHRLPATQLGELSADEPTRVLPSRWVSGCSMIFNLQQFQACPTFDLNFFLDYEDAEICERYGQQGHEVGVTQAVLVNHAVSAITHRNRRAKFRHATFSKLYFLYKHASALALGLNIVYILAWSLKLLLFDRETGIGRLQGWMDFMGWWLRALTNQLSPVPFRPRTAFTQSQ
ncbi:MAG: glycosyltransferase family 2 protein [Cyanobacteria bacterium J06634_5]